LWSVLNQYLRHLRFSISEICGPSFPKMTEVLVQIYAEKQGSNR
jgi:hypothetical protein